MWSSRAWPRDNASVFGPGVILGDSVEAGIVLKIFDLADGEVLSAGFLRQD